MSNKKIIGWYEYTVVENNVGINGEQYNTVTNYEPIFEGETEVDAKERIKCPKKKREDKNEE